MGWLSRLFPARSLGDVGGGADVVLPLVVASPDAIESTLAPVRAVAFHWTLLTHRGGGGVSVTGTPREAQARLVAFASGWRGETILARAADGRSVRIALDHAKLEALVDPEDGVPLGDSPASGRVYGEVATRAPTNGGLVYLREHAITSGQAIVLRARLEPIAAPASGYRAAAVDVDASFRTVGAVTIEDRALAVAG